MQHKVSSASRGPRVGAVIAIATLVVGLGGVAEAAKVFGQRSFESPEAAVEAMVAALEKDDVDALLDMFGREHEDELIGTDKNAAREARKDGLARIQEMNSLREDGAERRWLVMGREAWPFPIPLVKETNGWRFDTGAGIEEMLNRRIGANELNAIEVCQAFMDAQAEYALQDRDGDEVREYAQRFGSTSGKRDGLYWEAGPGDQQSPFGPLMAEAERYLEGAKPGDPYQGYYYRILKSQGANAPGGAYDYVINGNMIAGFAMLAFPADYGSSGIMSFQCSHNGKIFEKDLGEDTPRTAGAIDRYDPDGSWRVVGSL